MCVVVVAHGHPPGSLLAVGRWPIVNPRSTVNGQRPTANGCVHHPPDQFFVPHAGETRADHDVAGHRIHARQRIDFHEIRHAVAVAADVDARHVPQSEGAPHRPPHFGHVRRVGETVVDTVEVVALHFERVDERFSLAPGNHLHHADDLAVDEADGELVAGKKLLDQHGTVRAEPCDRRVELLLILAARCRRNPHGGAFGSRLGKKGKVQHRLRPVSAG